MPAMVGRPLLASFVASFVASFLVMPACDRAPGEASEETAALTPTHVDPWDPIDPAFAGCDQSCGSRADGPSPGVATQPGASVGDRVYCPTSGVVFEVTAESPTARLDDGRTLYFCCDACAQHFAEHRDEVLVARGMRGS